LENQSSGFLATVIRQSKGGQPASVEIVTLRDYQSRVGIATTADGVFHPLWSTVGDSFGELRTARIRVNGEPNPAAADSISLGSLADVTDRVTVLYGGAQRLDRESKSVMFDISFRNDGPAPIEGPLYVEVENTRSDFGDFALMNHLFDVPDHDSLRMFSCMGGNPLGPGRTSSPCHLVFRFISENAAGGKTFSILGIRLRIFCLRAG
jgi:hypothetical protein